MKRILVGLDASERAPDVLRAAVSLAAAQGARLFAVRAVSLPVEFPPEALAVTPEALPVVLLDAAQKGLERAVSEVPRELVERVEARLGTPWQVLCDSAKEFGADLVVIGTHGYKLLDRVIGTTAARVVNHAPCSVMVVRHERAPT